MNITGAQRWSVWGGGRLGTTTVSSSTNGCLVLPEELNGCICAIPTRFFFYITDTCRVEACKGNATAIWFYYLGEEE